MNKKEREAYQKACEALYSKNFAYSVSHDSRTMIAGSTDTMEEAIDLIYNCLNNSNKLLLDIWDMDDDWSNQEEKPLTQGQQVFRQNTSFFVLTIDDALSHEHVEENGVMVSRSKNCYEYDKNNQFDQKQMLNFMNNEASGSKMFSAQVYFYETWKSCVRIDLRDQAKTKHFAETDKSMLELRGIMQSLGATAVSENIAIDSEGLVEYDKPRIKRKSKKAKK